MDITKKIKTVVILCGHHSGSSMLAGCLHRMGVEMEEGESFLETPSGHAWAIHPKGMWERKGFEIMNDRIMKLAGGSWHHPPTTENIHKLINTEYVGNEIKKLIEKTQKDLWGWKDPRNAITIPVWHRHLMNPHYIVLYRALRPMIESYMCNTYRWKFGKYFKTETEAHCHIVEYYERIYEFILDKPKLLMVRYEDTLGCPERELARIAEFIGTEVNQEALDMVDIKLRHF